MKLFFEAKNCTNEFWNFWIKAKVLEITVAFRNKRIVVSNYAERMIKWEFPPADFFVLNTDGCVKGKEKCARAGGTLRGEDGFWVRGFSANLVRCNVKGAELWALLHDLNMTWDLNVTKLQLRMDSEEVVSWLNNDLVLNSNMQNLMVATRNLIHRDWSVEVTSVFRKANRVAYALAKNSLERERRVYVVDEIPAFLQPFLDDDSYGVAWARKVPISSYL